MLKVITNIGNSGLQSWFIQRVTAVILGLYTFFLFSYWIYAGKNNILAWQLLFVNKWMKYATFVVLLAFLCHAWIGVWTITTDYLRTLWLRLFAQICTYAFILFYSFWGFRILWT